MRAAEAAHDLHLDGEGEVEEYLEIAAKKLNWPTDSEGWPSRKEQLTRWRQNHFVRKTKAALTADNGDELAHYHELLALWRQYLDVPIFRVKRGDAMLKRVHEFIEAHGNEIPEGLWPENFLAPYPTWPRKRYWECVRAILRWYEANLGIEQVASIEVSLD